MNMEAKNNYNSLRSLNVVDIARNFKNKLLRKRIKKYKMLQY